jgi:glycosyltransferase involved in cell wall biosynthesis
MRICVITAGHLATCPRMVKAAQALKEAGHTVRTVSAQFLDWAAEADRALGAHTVVDYRRGTKPAKYWSTSLRFHGTRQWVKLTGVHRASLATLAAATTRASRDLVKLALAEPADLYYGGTCGGLSIAALAAWRAGVPYGLDLEDFHEGQSGDAHWCQWMGRIQREVLPGAAFLTAGSSAIAARYRQEYGLAVHAIHNTFPLPAQAPDPAPPGAHGLRLYWFSQTIGAGRGLEEVVRATALAGIRAELHLRGHGQPAYIATLRHLASETRARLTIHVHAPAPPDQMVDLCRPFDAGLSPEQGGDLNRQICLGNKALTYILAGLPVVLTETPGQRRLADDLGEGALRYQPGDIAALAGGLRRWATGRGRLRRAREAAWQAARQRWHWEHPAERGALLAAVEGAGR